MWSIRIPNSFEKLRFTIISIFDTEMPNSDNEKDLYQNEGHKFISFPANVIESKLRKLLPILLRNPVSDYEILIRISRLFIQYMSKSNPI